MKYSCLEELQVDLDLHMLDKINVLYKIGCQYDDGWLVVTNDGQCHLFNKDGNLDNIKKVTQLEEKHIRKDIVKIIIPDSITSIGDYMFDGCSSLTSVTGGNGVTSIGEMAFDYCSSLTGIMIPDSVTSIGANAFCNCSGLTSVAIGNGVTSIGEEAFYGCSGLTSMMIPNSVKSIKWNAFASCSGLVSVTISDSVTRIEQWTFFNCGKLTNLTFKGKTLKQVKKMRCYPWGIKNESIIKVE